MTELHGDPICLCPEGYIPEEETICIYDPEFYTDGTPEQAQCAPIPYFEIQCVAPPNNCPAGTSYNSLANKCAKCRAGKFSPGGTAKCSRCTAGSFSRPNRYSNIGASACTLCPAGTSSYPRRRSYSPTGSTGCSACAPGKYAPAGSKDCKECPRDTYSRAAQERCAACPRGKYSAQTGSTACA
eukprot:CAMPEP_0172170242 /NCGR_PEP_ID=MMETSP1050-20130122/11152_1 /TAXON_ID=233186 /ORGANISM="Cryptomonas curvata, Strain CCAP979/52" /LENGTH=183 /DNA_ID=CAMNT_0012841389 /DNA_START=400 /DNA_END=951 /DNA_ORIENTATION=-